MVAYNVRRCEYIQKHAKTMQHTRFSWARLGMVKGVRKLSEHVFNCSANSVAPKTQTPSAIGVRKFFHVKIHTPKFVNTYARAVFRLVLNCCWKLYQKQILHNIIFKQEQLQNFFAEKEIVSYFQEVNIICCGKEPFSSSVLRSCTFLRAFSESMGAMRVLPMVFYSLHVPCF